MGRFKINADAFARLVELLGERPRTFATLSELTGLHYTTVRDYVNALHRRRQVHIASWAKDTRGRNCVRMYALGFGKDAPRVKLSDAERMRNHRARKAEQQGKPRPQKRAIANSVFALGGSIQ
jgi:hypothetical protein